MRHVALGIDAAENRADDVEGGDEARARVRDVDANKVAGVRLQRVRPVLTGVAVERDPVGHHQPRLGHVERGRLACPGTSEAASLDMTKARLMMPDWVMSSEAGSLVPGLSRYHSLAT